MCVLSKEQSADSGESKINNENHDSVTMILKLMSEYAQQLRFSDKKDIVLVLGNTGAGKSTLTSILSDANLNSREIDTESGQWIIEDENGLISGESTITSKTIIPALMLNQTNQMVLYDCPGFNDTRDIDHDICVTYLIQEIIKRANRLKLVFVVNSESVRPGSGDRHDFLNLAEHAITFAKNIEKYQDAIALVVTKVENKRIKKNGDFVLVDDEKVIDTIARFLKQAKIALETNATKKNTSNEDKNNIIRFIDTLLKTNNGNGYERISIMRLAEESGSVDKIQMLQDAKRKIQEMIQNNIKYIEKENTDFRYTISDKSKNRITGIMEEIQTRFKDDLSGIGTEIKQFYMQQEKYIADLKVLKERISSGYRKLTEIQSTEPKTFVDIIINTANELAIGVSYNGSNKIWQDVEYIDFIKAVSNINLSILFDIKTGLNNTMQYLEDSQKWYQFLINLHDEFSKYRVQKQLPHIKDSLSSQIQLIDQLIFEENGETNVAALNLHKLLNDFECSSLYSSIENVRLNAYKVNALIKVLKQTTQEVITCLSNNTFIAKGYNVKICDIVHAVNQFSKFDVKYIKVFALNNLFIDSDVDKKGLKVELSLIAPKWIIIDQRKIILSGYDGKPHSELEANDDDGTKGGGSHGLPGLPGGPAGHILAIGNEFIDGRNLKIYIDGGKGGAGQNGGNGKDGEEGETPPEPGFHWFGQPFDTFNCRRTSLGVSKIPPFLTVDYDIEGGNAKKPSAGGNGGVGGIGGKSGQNFIGELKKRSHFVISTNQGDAGIDGSGGRGGKGTKSGKMIKAKCLFLIVGAVNIEHTKEDGEEVQRASDGRKGSDCIIQMQPEEPDSFVNKSHTINSYKEYVRENLANNIQESALRELLNDLDKNEKIQMEYDCLGFVNELLGIEKQYFKLRNRLSFVPFVKSLLARINKYSGSKYIMLTEKKLLNFLCTATLGKLCSIQNDTKHTVFDLPKYLELMRSKIKDLKKLERDASIRKYQKQFNRSLHSKMELAKGLIEYQVMPEINKIFNDTNEEISKLVGEVMGIKEADIKKQLMQSLAKKKLLFWLKVFGSLAVFLSVASIFVGLFTQIFGAVIVKNNKIPTNLSNLHYNGTSGHGHNTEAFTLFSAVFGSYNEIVDLVKQQLNHFNKKLENIEETLRKYFDGDGMKLIKKIISETKTKIKEYMENKEKSDAPYDLTEISKVKEELQLMINVEKQQAQKNKDHHSSKKIIKLDIARDILNDQTERSDTPRTHATLSDDLIDKLNNLDKIGQNMGKAIVEQVYQIRKSILDVHINLSCNSHGFILDISKWRIEDLIKDVMSHLQKMLSGMDVGQDLQRCFEKLNEGTSIMVSVYDRIDAYADKVELANYIANLSSSNYCHPSNEQGKEAILELEKMIETNRVLEYYEIAINVFKQHKFPFAQEYLSRFELPENLHYNDTELLKDKAIAQIESLAKDLHNSKVILGKYDCDIVTSESTTFYTWHYYDIKENLIKLFEGLEIFVRADIAKGIHENAVKFKEIAIDFKLKNETKQTDMDAKLKYFNVKMRMVDNMFYQCGQRSYCMSIIDNNIDFLYSIKKNPTGDPEYTNEVYKKIKDGDFFLSPYTLWAIQLESREKVGDFSHLKEFKDEIMDVQLRGHGQYLKQSTSFTRDVSINDLDKQYHFNSIISFENAKLMNNF
ncbi:uncharacterized protein LOC116345674 [Contarinia nasturtii]|uniref:uncharacterized protein LOC116345674 n=1 Tax=Contarinia nasturtii TaxID=265458 RepID=UPI0012D3D70F|nr:uncharacterized protein LOC116345674 [Contarinia nasturtii]